MTPTRLTPARQGLFKRIGRFFYEEEVPYGLALVRILLPLVLLVPMLPRWPVARELYSLDGAPSPLWVNYGWTDFLPLLPGTAVVALHTALLFFLVAAAFGWKTRFSLIASTILYTYLNLCDSMGTMTKYSVIASHTLMLLSLSHCGAVWSIDAWLKRRRSMTGTSVQREYRRPRFPVWPRRLAQLLMGIVYFGAAITKMHTPAFFSGEQLQTWLLSNVNYSNPFGEYLALYPAVTVVFAYVVLVWEVLFVFLVWRGWGRISMLGLGVVFHIMTTLTLGLYVFPMVCLSIYFSFASERDVQRWRLAVRRLRRRLRHRGWVAELPRLPQVSLPPALQFPSALLYAAAAIGMTVVGIEIEHHRDLYGQRRAEGPYTLKELDPEVVAKMIGPPKPLRLKDMFDTFEIGTDLIGGMLFDRRTEFRQGEIAIAQVSFNAPHHDLWVECNLHDERGNLVDRLGQVVSREMYRANFPYHLSHVLEPGQYDLVLQCAGREIMRRRIILKPGRKSAVAN